MRPVSHDVGVDGGRELREFVDEHNDEALQMRLFVRFDTAGVAHLNEVRIAFPRLVRASKRSTGPEQVGEKTRTAVKECILKGCSAFMVPRLFERSTCVHVGHSQIRRATLAHLGRGAARDLPFGTRTPGET